MLDSSQCRGTLQLRENREIPNFEEEENILEGWLGKPDGLLKNKTNLEIHHIISGQKNYLKIIKLNFSLKNLLCGCFVRGGEYAAVFRTKRMGIIVNQRPYFFIFLGLCQELIKLPHSENMNNEKLMASMRACPT